MASARVEIHDRATQALIDVLENAHAISYTQEVNKTPQASFKLPRSDPKWAAVQPFREVWIYSELGILIDVFRIMPLLEQRTEAGISATVTCEGFGTALQDDIVPAELIYVNTTPSAILAAVLGYQTVGRITLGTVDAVLNIPISLRFSYDNLMLAAWAVRNVVGGYITIDPDPANPAIRTLNLRANPGQNIGQRINRGLNLREIGKTSDPTQAVTKIWPLGRGSGVAQIRPSTNKLLAQAAAFTGGGGAARSVLVIAALYSRYKGWTAAGAALPDGSGAIDTRSRPLKVYFGATDDSANWEQGADERTIRSKVNGYVPPAGAPTLDYVHADYLIADDTIAAYGTIQRPLTEKRHEASASLINGTAQVLAVAKQPRVSYQVKVADLARVYPTESFERLNLFDQVRVWDPELGITTTERIVAVSYGDLWDPSAFSVTVATVDAEPTEVKLADRIRKYETMPDGAPNIWVDSFEDNLDATHPYSRDIYVPADATAILKLTLNMSVKKYRYYVSASIAAEGTHKHGVSATSGTDSQLPAPDTHAHAAAPAGSGFWIVDPANPDSYFTQSENPSGLGHGHTHVMTLTPGIVETTTPTTMQLKVDGTVASASATTLTDFDLTAYLTKDSNGNIVRGWHTLLFTPDVNGRVQCAIVEQVFLQSRGVVAG